MKLRYRMFLQVGLLFIICFILAGLLQTYFTTRTLKKGESEASFNIEELHQQKRKRIVKFLSQTVAQKLGQLETLLMGISAYPIGYKAMMQPSEAWQAVDEVLFSNKWLDFLEHSLNGKLLSSVVVDSRSMQTALITGKARGLEGIYQLQKEQEKFVAVEIPLAILDIPVVNKNHEQPKLYLVFSNEQLPLFERMQFENGSSDLAPVIKILEERLLCLASSPLVWEPQMLNTETPLGNRENGDQYLQEELNAMMLRSDTLSAIRTLTTILNQRLFGDSPTSAQFPKGVALFKEKESVGSFVRTESVLLDQIEVQTEAKGEIAEQMPFTPFVVADEKERLFLASSLTLFDGSNRSDLLVGASIDAMTEMLSIAFDAPVFCVFQGQVYLPAFLKESSWSKILQGFPYEKTLEQSDGIVKAGDCSLFFIRVRPLPGIDLHFFTVNPAKKEFAFLETFEEGVKAVIEEIIKKMSVVALFAMVIVLLSLSRLAKRITEPITKLAKAASAVGKGKLSEVVLPKIRIDQSDEVHSLYDSFDEMIQSLKDKEKVRAALNKVVSPVIAAEILKSNMVLGGERKTVCVLFADIRGFSKMTEAMRPEEVIVMLNHCMTKVSQIVEENSGLIDKYVGDEVMALFGIPKAKQEDGLHAVKTAFEIQKRLSEWNVEREREEKPPIHMGIGIDIGDVVAGNMGADDRQNYTVLGSHVNLAARLCALAPRGKIFLSEAVASAPQVREQFIVREVGKELVKGFSEPVLVYEVEAKCS